MKAHNMKLKQTQHGVKLKPKPTPRSKKNKTREKHMKGRHMQR
jgi:hypothetical protein